MHKVLKVFSLLALVSLLFISGALIFFKEAIFLERTSISRPEIAIIIAFCCYLLFNILSLIFLASKQTNSNSKGIFGLVRGILGLFALWGEKVMIDEIGRESLLHRETKREWLILYGLLALQLGYVLRIIVEWHKYCKKS